MKLLIVVNRYEEVTASQTTAALARAAQRRGHEVWLTDAVGISLTADDTLMVRARRASSATEPAAWVKSLRAAPSESLPLDSSLAVWIRTNPGRDERGALHRTLLDLLAYAQSLGIKVVNDPTALRAASSKLYLSRLPAHTRPRTAVSSDPLAIEEMVRQADHPMVLKPLNGSRGSDVFMVEPGSYANLRQIIDVLVRSGTAMVQDFVPEAAEGDTRLVLMNGEPLVAEGRAAAVRRIPSGTDFRSNVHVGGRPAMAELDARLQAIADAVGPVLRADGLWLAGLDVIGDKVVEVNVFSTGGLVDAEQFYGVDFMSAVVEGLEAELG